MESAIVPLIPNRSASPHFCRYSSPIPQKVGGWVGLGGWLHTEVVYPPEDGHPSHYQPTDSAVPETNSRPSSPKSDALTTRLPSHRERGCINRPTTAPRAVVANTVLEVTVTSAFSYYPHTPIGNVWIHRFFFVCFLCVCTVTDFFAEVKSYRRQILHGGLSASKTGNLPFWGTLLP